MNAASALPNQPVGSGRSAGPRHIVPSRPGSSQVATTPPCRDSVVVHPAAAAAADAVAAGGAGEPGQQVHSQAPGRVWAGSRWLLRRSSLARTRLLKVKELLPRSGQTGQPAGSSRHWWQLRSRTGPLPSAGGVAASVLRLAGCGGREAMALAFAQLGGLQARGWLSRRISMQNSGATWMCSVLVVVRLKIVATLQLVAAKQKYAILCFPAILSKGFVDVPELAILLYFVINIGLITWTTSLKLNYNNDCRSHSKIQKFLLRIPLPFCSSFLQQSAGEESEDIRQRTCIGIPLPCPVCVMVPGNNYSGQCPKLLMDLIWWIWTLSHACQSGWASLSPTHACSSNLTSLHLLMTGQSSLLQILCTHSNCRLNAEHFAKLLAFIYPTMPSVLLCKHTFLSFVPVAEAIFLPKFAGQRSLQFFHLLFFLRAQTKLITDMTIWSTVIQHL